MRVGEQGKIRYIPMGSYSSLYDSFQKIFEHIIEVERIPYNAYTDNYYKILDTPFNREVFRKTGAEPIFLIGKRIRGNRCEIVKEYVNNKAALEVLKKEKRDGLQTLPF